jgi:hypothetical protein
MTVQILDAVRSVRTEHVQVGLILVRRGRLCRRRDIERLQKRARVIT